MPAALAHVCRRPLRQLFRRRENRGVAALEFGMIAPLFALILAGTVDIGDYLYTTMRLNTSVSAGANFALVNAADVGMANGPTLANNIAIVVASATAINWASATVVVNNGPTFTITNPAGIQSAGGTAPNANGCYCPTGSSGNWNWGSAVSCGSACTNGGLAGQFVAITASQSFTPIFTAYGFLSSGTITAAAMVQTQ